MMDVLAASKKIREIVKKHEGCSLNAIYRELKKQGIGRKRIKDIIFSDSRIKVVIVAKKSKNCDLARISQCNACGSKKLRSIYAVDLKGKKSLKAKKCLNCGFVIREGKCKVYKYQIYEVKSL